MPHLRDSFAALVADGDRCDLGRAALEIARLAYPELEPSRYLRQLDTLADGVRARARSARDHTEAVGAVSEYLFDECGFHGNRDDYYDPRNSFLNEVLERRTGIPISLSVVMMETSARLGLHVEGVAFPGHFLVRIAGAAGPIVLDPFFGGRPIGHDEMLRRLRAFSGAGGGAAGEDLQRVLPQALQSTGATGILGRMLANLLRIYLERDEPTHALATVELLLVLAPSAPEHLRVRGLLYERLECGASAAADFRRYLELAPDGAHAAEIQTHLTRLGNVAATLH